MEPISVEPTWVEPISVEPISVEPISVEPTWVEPTSVEPTSVAHTSVAPISVAPISAEPISVEPISVEPTWVEPISVEPTWVEPTSVEPTWVEPTWVEPTSVEPTWVEPTSVEPTWVEPTWVEPTWVEPTSAAPTWVEPTSVEHTSVEPTSVAPTWVEPTLGGAHLGGAHSAPRWSPPRRSPLGWSPPRRSPLGWSPPRRRPPRWRTLWAAPTSADHSHADTRAADSSACQSLQVQWGFDRFHLRRNQWQTHRKSKVLTTRPSIPRPAPGRRAPNRQTVEVVGLSIILAGIAGLTIAVLPDLEPPCVRRGLWAAALIALGFATTLLTVVRIEFRENAILFSLSEIPLAFAVVFLDPVTGTLCRIVASGLVFALVKRPPIHKQLFNLALFAFETSVAYLVIRTVLVPDPGSDIEVILCATVAVTIAGAAGSVAVAIAVSRLVGDTLRRIVDDLKAVWVLVVNGAMAGALLSLFLLSPTFAALATVPVVALWYMMRRHGRLGQQLRDLRAIHGFAGRIGRSLDLDEIGDSAVTEASRMLRADFTMLAVVATDGRARMFATDGSPRVERAAEDRRLAEPRRRDVRRRHHRGQRSPPRVSPDSRSAATRSSR